MMKQYIKIFSLILVVLGLYSCSSQPNKKILFVLTSHAELGDTGKETGFFLSELTHPWQVLNAAGYKIDFVSPKGGQVPVDGFDLSDSINQTFWRDEVYQQKLKNTAKPSEITPNEYAAIHYVGGHGTMWDFPQNAELASIAAAIYENQGVVSAVCHGPAGLLNIKLQTGAYLLKNKKVAAFTNLEVAAVELDSVVPFSLEDELKKRGAEVITAPIWSENVVVDQGLITGQNPASAHKLGLELVRALRLEE